MNSTTEDYTQRTYTALLGLWERGFMTPSYLSAGIMYAILPAKLQQLFHRRKTIPNIQEETTTHTLTSSLLNGIETLRVTQKTPSTDCEYEIFCCGNQQDAMNTNFAKSRITANADKNYIFWNYPGVG